MLLIIDCLHFSFADVTLSALNAPESDIDIEGDSSSSKKLEFDSGSFEIHGEDSIHHVCLFEQFTFLNKSKILINITNYSLKYHGKNSLLET